MQNSRESIYLALFTLVAAVPGFVTTSRRLRHWDDVTAAEQPALFQAQKTEVAATRFGMPTKWHLHADLALYVNTGQDPTAISATLLNGFIDAIEAALAPNPGTGVQTLGALVSHCWIEGTIQTDEGTLGAQAVALIPIEILAV